ncbi:MAG: type II toxin-antitoxin system VapC family toxin [Deltaproteobacteria bacterium]|nr:type II toxin-antitoxin system VapC family toxin [Deltaproteobacteria bacterium]
MILPDVNILVYAHRRDMRDHAAYRDWLETQVNADAAFGLSDLVVSGFIRVVTHPRVFRTPTAVDDALAFALQLRSQPNRISVAPGDRHWEIFSGLCESSGAKGNLIPDAYFAALAIEHGCEWITADRDYSRFQGLNWRHPLAT